MSVASDKTVANSDGQSQRSSDSESLSSPKKGRRIKNSYNDSSISDQSHRNSARIGKIEKRAVSKSSYSYSEDSSSSTDDDSVQYSRGSSISVRTSSANRRSKSSVQYSARSSSGNKEILKWSSSSKPSPYSKKILLKEFNSLHGNRNSQISTEIPEPENLRRIRSATNKEIRELYSQRAALKAELKILEEENKLLRMDVGHQGKELKNIQPVQDLMMKQWDEIRKLRKRVHRKQVKCSERDEQIKATSKDLQHVKDRISRNKRLLDRKDLKSEERLVEECFQIRRDLDYTNSQIQRLQNEIEEMKKNHLNEMRKQKMAEQENKSNVQESQDEIKKLQSLIKEVEKRLDIVNIYTRNPPAQYHQVLSLKSSSATNSVQRNESANKSNVPFLPPLSGASGKQIESESEADIDVSSGSTASDEEKVISQSIFNQDSQTGVSRRRPEAQVEEFKLDHLEPLPDVENRLSDAQRNELQRRLKLIDERADPRSNDLSKSGMANKVNNKQIETLKRLDSLTDTTDVKFLNKKQPIEAENLPKFGDYQPSFTATGQARNGVHGGRKPGGKDEVGKMVEVDSKNDTWIENERNRIKVDSDKLVNNKLISDKLASDKLPSDKLPSDKLVRSKKQRERSLLSMKPDTSSDDDDVEDVIKL